MRLLHLAFSLAAFACLGAGGFAWVLIAVAGVKSFQGQPLHERRVSLLSRSWVTSKLAGRIRMPPDETAFWRRVGRWATLAFFCSIAALGGIAILDHVWG